MSVPAIIEQAGSSLPQLVDHAAAGLSNARTAAEVLEAKDTRDSACARGKGNADKQAMIAAVRERGFEPGDDNEADAIAILLWALETEGGVA